MRKYYLYRYSSPVRHVLSYMNCAPCSGFVRMFAYISFVPLCTITASPALTLSRIQKFRMAICRVRSAPDLPLSINAMHDVLS